MRSGVSRNWLPGAQRRGFGAELPRFANQSEKAVLHNLFGIGLGPRQHPREPVYCVAVAFVQKPKRHLVAAVRKGYAVSKSG